MAKGSGVLDRRRHAPTDCRLALTGGAVFAGYTVEGQIGAGATGVVWLATQVGIDRKVAIKQLAPALAGEQAVGVLRGALTGLVAAHAAGVVHGDVSATNILVDTEGTSKLVDFGLASSPGEPPSSATPAYASPEVVQGAPLDARSDVYS